MKRLRKLHNINVVAPLCCALKVTMLKIDSYLMI